MEYNNLLSICSEEINNTFNVISSLGWRNVISRLTRLIKGIYHLYSYVPGVSSKSLRLSALFKLISLPHPSPPRKKTPKTTQTSSLIWCPCFNKEFPSDVQWSGVMSGHTFLYFFTKTYVVGTQKNNLCERFSFEYPKHNFKLNKKSPFNFAYLGIALKSFFFHLYWKLICFGLKNKTLDFMLDIRHVLSIKIYLPIFQYCYLFILDRRNRFV